MNDIKIQDIAVFKSKKILAIKTRPGNNTLRRKENDDEDGISDVAIETDGGYFLITHVEDYSEDVSLYDTDDDLQSMVGAVINDVPQKEDDKWPRDVSKEFKYEDSFTWTYITFKTNKSSLQMRWLGISNGYYTELVDVLEIDEFEWNNF